MASAHIQLKFAFNFALIKLPEYVSSDEGQNTRKVHDDDSYLIHIPLSSANKASAFENKAFKKSVRQNLKF